MKVIIFVVSFLSIQLATDAFAQKAGDEPGWSVMVLTVAAACGADRAKVNEAATYVAQWATRHLQDPSRLTQEKVMKEIDDAKDTKDIVKAKGAFIYPCDRWRKMLDVFIESKGSVMEKR